MSDNWARAIAEAFRGATGYAVVDGLPRVFAAIARENNREGLRLRRSIEGAANHLLRATLPYVPIDLGDLIETGRVIEDERRSGNPYEGIEFRVEFGGTAPSGREVDYAVEVHENLAFFHMPPTQAKFLARAIAENRATMAAIIRANYGVGMGTR